MEKLVVFARPDERTCKSREMLLELACADSVLEIVDVSFKALVLFEIITVLDRPADEIVALTRPTRSVVCAELEDASSDAEVLVADTGSLTYDVVVFWAGATGAEVLFAAWTSWLLMEELSCDALENTLVADVDD